MEVKQQLFCWKDYGKHENIIAWIIGGIWVISAGTYELGIRHLLGRDGHLMNINFITGWKERTDSKRNDPWKPSQKTRLYNFEPLKPHFCI